MRTKVGPDGRTQLALIILARDIPASLYPRAFAEPEAFPFAASRERQTPDGCRKVAPASQRQG
jgi:hypothetical protein